MAKDFTFQPGMPSMVLPGGNRASAEDFGGDGGLVVSGRALQGIAAEVEQFQDAQAELEVQGLKSELALSLQKWSEGYVGSAPRGAPLAISDHEGFARAAAKGAREKLSPRARAIFDQRVAPALRQDAFAYGQHVFEREQKVNMAALLDEADVKVAASVARGAVSFDEATQERAQLVGRLVRSPAEASVLTQQFRGKLSQNVVGQLVAGLTDSRTAEGLLERVTKGESGEFAGLSLEDRGRFAEATVHKIQVFRDREEHEAEKLRGKQIRGVSQELLLLGHAWDRQEISDLEYQEKAGALSGRLAGLGADVNDALGFDRLREINLDRHEKELLGRGRQLAQAQKAEEQGRVAEFERAALAATSPEALADLRGSAESSDFSPGAALRISQVLATRERQLLKGDSRSQKAEEQDRVAEFERSQKAEEQGLRLGAKEAREEWYLAWTNGKITAEEYEGHLSSMVDSKGPSDIRMAAQVARDRLSRARAAEVKRSLTSEETDAIRQLSGIGAALPDLSPEQLASVPEAISRVVNAHSGSRAIIRLGATVAQQVQAFSNSALATADRQLLADYRGREVEIRVQALMTGESAHETVKKLDALREGAPPEIRPKLTALLSYRPAMTKEDRAAEEIFSVALAAQSGTPGLYNFSEKQLDAWFGAVGGQVPMEELFQQVQSLGQVPRALVETLVAQAGDPLRSAGAVEALANLHEVLPEALLQATPRKAEVLTLITAHQGGLLGSGGVTARDILAGRIQPQPAGVRMEAEVGERLEQVLTAVPVSDRESLRGLYRAAAGLLGGNQESAVQVVERHVRSQYKESQYAETGRMRLPPEEVVANEVGDLVVNTLAVDLGRKPEGWTPSLYKRERSPGQHAREVVDSRVMGALINAGFVNLPDQGHRVIMTPLPGATPTSPVYSVIVLGEDSQVLAHLPRFNLSARRR